MKLLSKLLPSPVKSAARRFVNTQAEAQIAALRGECDARLAQLERDFQVRQAQVESALSIEFGLLPIPPKHLQIRVSGLYYPEFVTHGYTLADQLGRHLTAATGKGWADFPRVLDFGCGCGRVARAVRRLMHPTAALHGVDIDPEAVAWCARHYPGVADFRTCPTAPPTPFADAAFDLVYGVSVFTHLPEDMQFAWLAELRRVTRPGGLLALTTHGEHHPDWDKAADARGRGFLYTVHHTVAGLPDFYQGACHTHEYIRREWGKHFDVLGIADRGLDNWQDIVFLRRRDD